MKMEEQFYYLNREPAKDGLRYIHTYECEGKPAPLFLIKLGFFKNAQHALLEGQKYYAKVGLCKDCCSLNDEILSHTYLYQQNKSQEIL